MLIGLLALQGDYAAHRAVVNELGASTTLVRTPGDLEELDGLVVPGGESTVMSRLLDRYELREPLRERIKAGMPVLGTCAGLILLARQVEGTSENFAQRSFGVLDVCVERNAYGAQRESFETDVFVPVLNDSVRGVFIRAPRIARVGDGVEVLADHPEGTAEDAIEGASETAPVLVRQNQIVACAFHPEIAGETRVHQLWLNSI